MKRYLMNKNVDHNGKKYAKGVEISKGDEGFEEIIQAGHADALNLKESSEESLPQEEPAESHKSAHKSKR